MKLYRLLAGLIAICAYAEAGTPPKTPAAVQGTPIHYTQQITLPSEVLGREVSLRVFLPESFHESSDEHSYPLIFANGSHGTHFFHTLSGIVKHLGELDRMPESIVVSLDYGGDIPEIYTNGMWTSRDRIGPDGDPVRFERHLRQELIPYFENHYRAADFRMLIGVSGSSLYPLYNLTHSPDLFQAHILYAAADMIGMGYKPGETFINSIAHNIADAEMSWLYVGAADSDTAENPAYTDNMRQLQARLARHRGEKLTFKTDILAGENHYAGFIKAMLNAMEMIFPQKDWSPRYRDLVAQPGNALGNIDAFYERLSRRYGITILPKADRWNSVNCLRFVTQHLIQQERTVEAIAVARRWVQYRPRSAKALDGLAEAQEADNNLAAASETLEKAVQLAGRYDESNLSAYKERLAELNKKITKANL